MKDKSFKDIRKIIHVPGKSLWFHVCNSNDETSACSIEITSSTIRYHEFNTCKYGEGTWYGPDHQEENPNNKWTLMGIDTICRGLLGISM